MSAPSSIRILLPADARLLYAASRVASVADALSCLLANSFTSGASRVACSVDLRTWSLSVEDDGRGVTLSEVARVESARFSSLALISELAIVEISSIPDSGGISGAWSATMRSGEWRLRPSTQTQARRRGTAVHLRQLFVALPVRRLQLAESRSFERCVDCAMRIAMLYPSVSLTLFDAAAGTVGLRLPSALTLDDRLRAAAAGAYSGVLKAVHGTSACGKYRIKGVLGLQRHSSPCLQYAFVNGRPWLDLTAAASLVEPLFALAEALQTTQLQLPCSAAALHARAAAPGHAVFVLDFLCVDGDCDATFCTPPRGAVAAFRDPGAACSAISSCIESAFGLECGALHLSAIELARSKAEPAGEHDVSILAIGGSAASALTPVQTLGHHVHSAIPGVWFPDSTDGSTAFRTSFVHTCGAATCAPLCTACNSIQMLLHVAQSTAVPAGFSSEAGAGLSRRSCDFGAQNAIRRVSTSVREEVASMQFSDSPVEVPLIQDSGAGFVRSALVLCVTVPQKAAAPQGPALFQSALHEAVRQRPLPRGLHILQATHADVAAWSAPRNGPLEGALAASASDSAEDPSTSEASQVLSPFFESHGASRHHVDTNKRRNCMFTSQQSPQLCGSTTSQSASGPAFPFQDHCIPQLGVGSFLKPPDVQLAAARAAVAAGVDDGQIGTTLSLPAMTAARVDRGMLSRLRCLGQLDAKFILAVVAVESSAPGSSGGASNTIVVLDQHAVDERVRLELMEGALFGVVNIGDSRTCFASAAATIDVSRDGLTLSQRDPLAATPIQQLESLLSSVRLGTAARLSLTPLEWHAAKRHLAILRAWGFDVEIAGLGPTSSLLAAAAQPQELTSQQKTLFEFDSGTATGIRGGCLSARLASALTQTVRHMPSQLSSAAPCGGGAVGFLVVHQLPYLFDVALDVNDLREFLAYLAGPAARDVPLSELPAAGRPLTAPERLKRVQLLFHRGIKPPAITRILHSKACRGAIMFGMRLPSSSCDALVRMLPSCRFPFQCAHGRPAMLPLISLVGSNG